MSKDSSTLVPSDIGPGDMVTEEFNKALLMTSEEREQATTFTVYKYRFLVLALYCSAAMLNQICWVSLQPVAAAIENAYGVGPNKISSIGFIYMIIFILANFPANVLFKRVGSRVSVSETTRIKNITNLPLSLDHNRYFFDSYGHVDQMSYQQELRVDLCWASVLSSWSATARDSPCKSSIGLVWCERGKLVRISAL
jgi:hypothetical protein